MIGGYLAPNGRFVINNIRLSLEVVNSELAALCRIVELNENPSLHMLLTQCIDVLFIFYSN